jgi:uncharacterized protein YjbJ (UPF0337 family)
MVLRSKSDLVTLAALPRSVWLIESSLLSSGLSPARYSSLQMVPLDNAHFCIAQMLWWAWSRKCIAGTFAPPDHCLRESITEKNTMGSTTDKVKGVANEAIGKAKQSVGEAVDSDKLKGEGLVQEAKGHGQQALGDAKAAAKEAVDKAANYAHRKL